MILKRQLRRIVRESAHFPCVLHRDIAVGAVLREAEYFSCEGFRDAYKAGPASTATTRGMRAAAIFSALLLGVVASAFAQTNTTAGGPLRPGVYGRIEIGKSAPPPVIFATPVVASRAVPPASVKPVYLYIPPGQVRKWERHCGKYDACDLPVYFVRMDDSPSKLGRWKSRNDVASRDPEMALRTMGGPPGAAK